MIRIHGIKGCEASRLHDGHFTLFHHAEAPAKAGKKDGSDSFFAGI